MAMPYRTAGVNARPFNMYDPKWQEGEDQPEGYAPAGGLFSRPWKPQPAELIPPTPDVDRTAPTEAQHNAQLPSAVRPALPAPLPDGVDLSRPSAPPAPGVVPAEANLSRSSAYVDASGGPLPPPNYNPRARAWEGAGDKLRIEFPGLPAPAPDERFMRYEADGTMRQVPYTSQDVQWTPANAPGFAPVVTPAAVQPNAAPLPAAAPPAVTGRAPGGALIAPNAIDAAVAGMPAAGAVSVNPRVQAVAEKFMNIVDSGVSPSRAFSKLRTSDVQGVDEGELLAAVGLIKRQRIQDKERAKLVQSGAATPAGVAPGGALIAGSTPAAITPAQAAENARQRREADAIQRNEQRAKDRQSQHEWDVAKTRLAASNQAVTDAEQALAEAARTFGEGSDQHRAARYELDKAKNVRNSAANVIMNWGAQKDVASIAPPTPQQTQVAAKLERTPGQALRLARSTPDGAKAVESTEKWMQETYGPKYKSVQEVQPDKTIRVRSFELPDRAAEFDYQTAAEEVKSKLGMDDDAIADLASRQILIDFMRKNINGRGIREQYDKAMQKWGKTTPVTPSAEAQEAADAKRGEELLAKAEMPAGSARLKDVTTVTRGQSAPGGDLSESRLLEFYAKNPGEGNFDAALDAAKEAGYNVTREMRDKYARKGRVESADLRAEIVRNNPEKSSRSEMPKPGKRGEAITPSQFARILELNNRDTAAAIKAAQELGFSLPKGY